MRTLQERAVDGFRNHMVGFSLPLDGVAPIFEPTTLRKTIDSYIAANPQFAACRSSLEAVRRSGPEYPPQLDDVFMVLTEACRRKW